MHRATGPIPSTSQNWVSWSITIPEFSGGEGRSSSHPGYRVNSSPASATETLSQGEKKKFWKIQQGITVEDYHGSPVAGATASHPHSRHQSRVQIYTQSTDRERELPVGQGYAQTNPSLRWVSPRQHSHWKAVNRHLQQNSRLEATVWRPSPPRAVGNSEWPRLLPLLNKTVPPPTPGKVDTFTWIHLTC